MIGLLRKLFIKSIGGTRNERLVRARMKIVHEKINPLEEQVKALSPDQLMEKSRKLREDIIAGKVKRDDALPEAFAMIREASRRGREHRQYDVQLVAGMILDHGWIAEEATGEGKTIACYPAIYMAWLEGMKTHVVTVNDYLVKRDAEFAMPVFELLGMSVGYIQSEMDHTARQTNYACDVTYGTNSEFGFDYLRDNMKMSKEEQVQGSLDFAIIDEVDSILIDEARTPLIISGPSTGDTSVYKKADRVARELINRHRPWANANKRVDAITREVTALEGAVKDKNQKSDDIKQKLDKKRDELKVATAERDKATKYYEVELDKKSCHLTHEGIGAAQEIAGVGSFYVGSNMEWPHLMDQSLRAHLVYEKDKDYVVRDNKIIIVDEFTGRLLDGRQWSDGLHQAVEAKERVTIKEENQTLATITLQNYFKLYKKLSGMTGTAMTEANEFMKIYKLDVVEIPTNRPCVRDDQEDVIYGDDKYKYKHIVENIKENSFAGRPVLVGTTSIEKSEYLSNLLTKTYGIDHELLNGRPENATREADIVAKAGLQRPRKPGSKQMVGNVTIATNMAGRGTDIKLSNEAKAAGGLHIVGTERHESRRVDNQLRGRAGRQGDPGSSIFYLSLDDDLLQMFAAPWVRKMIQFMGVREDEPIVHKRISNAIRKAQKKVEERNFEIRKSLLDYDEVMDHQRKAFYSLRQNILDGKELDSMVFDMVALSTDEAVENYLESNYTQRSVAELARTLLRADIRDDQVRVDKSANIELLESELREIAKSEAFQAITITIGEYIFEDVDSKDWDLKGLRDWAHREHGAGLSVNKMKAMTAKEIEDSIYEQAIEKIDSIDLSSIAPLFEADYAKKSLCEWARSKFDISIEASELDGSPDDARELIGQKVRDLYQQRRIEYPVEYALDMTVAQSGMENVYALDSLAGWVKYKFNEELKIEDWQGKPINDLYKHLIEISKSWNTGGKLEEEIRGKSAQLHNSKSAIEEYIRERFDSDQDAESLAKLSKSELESRLAEIGKAFLCRDLTQLEAYVLLQICDSSWKDHLLNMDHLKGSIGLRAFAEKDPKVAYKTEGSRMFEEMFGSIRDKVTDMIFKVRLAADDTQAQSVYDVSSQTHEEVQGYGHLSEGAQQQQLASEPPKISQIINDTMKVGRNDPCPCGSGKKFKKCCGRE